MVSEGETERMYFEHLCRDLGINGANFESICSDGTAPINVVETAIERFSIEEDFDAIFCVFDRDEHTTYSDALCRIGDTQLIRKADDNAARFEAITSVPCFEYWLLIHFVNTDAPFAKTEVRTAAENAMHRLRREYRAFKKGRSSVYCEIKDRIDDAIATANRVMRQADDENHDNPSTRVVVLVEYIRQVSVE